MERPASHSSTGSSGTSRQPDLIRRLDATLTAAVDSDASDIHFEPHADGLSVRIRIDGVLRTAESYPAASAAGVASRLKLLARMDIAERRLPQDGRLELVGRGGDRVEARVSSLPTVYGEKLVLRLLRDDSDDRPLSALGMPTEPLETLQGALRANMGMILVTGPTGSGKSTTLYAALRELNSDERNLVTAEDPVERRIPGVNQVQVNTEIGWTFAEALRAFLRQDPDVLMVGEIRDRETAEIAVRAALTGHLVLSTLHTNDAASTVARLIDMGIAPFLVAASLRLIVAQRLVRRRCQDCSGRGCETCGQLGLRGRTAIFEIMPITESLRREIGRGCDVDEIRRVAAAEGTRTLADAARECVASGTTTELEARRATGT